MSQVCVVVPCYNEAKRLQGDRFVEFARMQPHIRFLFVNDGSTDATADVLQGLTNACPQQMRWHNQPQNGGKAEAVRTGMQHALADTANSYVAFWDADLATPLDTILLFQNILDRRPEFQVVLGSRVRLLGRTIERKPARHYIGRIFATLASLSLRLPVYDTQCGAKMFRNTPIATDLFADAFCSRWIFDVEILARLMTHPAWTDPADARRVVYELPLDEWHDIAGSKLKFRDGLRAGWDLWQISRRYKAGRHQ